MCDLLINTKLNTKGLKHKFTGWNLNENRTLKDKQCDNKTNKTKGHSNKFSPKHFLRVSLLL